MNRFFTKILFFLLSFFILGFNVFASNEEVEDIFNDITSDYKYLNELQSLYDKWMIKPDANWNFNPKTLLTREEFVWISMHTICEECISPNTPDYLIEKYRWQKPFYDVLEDWNDYFYCIALAKDKGYVKWYDIGYTCEDSTNNSTQSPFCSYNNITLEEAIAVLLRNSWIFTIEDNEETMSKISAWIINTDISNDVWVRNTDWSIYTFYWYLSKALEYKLVDYDIYWNKKEYYLLEKDNEWNINPKKNITKEEFLRLAYITTKANSCSLRSLNTSNDLDNNFEIDTQISIYDTTCKTSTSDFLNTNGSRGPYCFKADTSNEGEDTTYRWTFINKNTWTTLESYWEELNNVNFPEDWNWQINLEVNNNAWNWNSQSNINIWNLEGINMIIETQPDSSWDWMRIPFTPIVSWWEWEYTYAWDFWDWQTSNEESPIHDFSQEWNYEVNLTVTDENWNEVNSSITVSTSSIERCLWDWNCSCSNWYICSTLDTQSCSLSWICLKDTDFDEVADQNDSCPFIAWDKNNNWCPILDRVCSTDDDCDNWFYCSTTNFCEVKKEDTTSCIVPSNNSSIFWNMICNSCPCSLNLDFTADMRKCDVVFPAIVSPTWKDIYSRWKAYQIPYK